MVMEMTGRVGAATVAATITCAHRMSKWRKASACSGVHDVLCDAWAAV